MGAYGDDAAPNFRLQVGGVDLEENMTEFVSMVQYESCDGIIDKLQVEVNNPNFEISELKLFLPGNEIGLWGGYGNSLQFIGRGIITNVRTQFPVQGVPVITVKALTRDYLMTERKPDIDQNNEGSEKVWFEKGTIADVIETVASRQGYRFQTDIDPTEDQPRNYYQVKEVTDYDFVYGLANLVGFVFWVDGDDNGTWTLHFKHPKNVVQEKMYTFQYFAGDDSTLLNMEPELLFKDHFTKVQAELTMPDGKVIRKVFIYDDEIGPHEWTIQPTAQDEKVEGGIGEAAAIKVYFNDYSVAIPNTEGIRNVHHLESYIDRWVNRHAGEFVLGKGNVIGLETLMSRQVHAVEGLGTLYDGKWYFSRVRHVFDQNGGYTCDFDGRRVAG